MRKLDEEIKNKAQDMIDLKKFEVWFITGTQDLYGDETLKQVAIHAQQVAESLNQSKISVRVVYKPIVKTPEEILETLQQANITETCIGIVTWMHTFSPAKCGLEV